MKVSDAGSATAHASPAEPYTVQGFFDEMFDDRGRPRSSCEKLYAHMRGLSADDLARRQRAADLCMQRLGITFNVYGNEEGAERIIPFDIVPRIISDSEWRWLERGLKQRIVALNLFIEDVYHEAVCPQVAARVDVAVVVETARAAAQVAGEKNGVGQ